MSKRHPFAPGVIERCPPPQRARRWLRRAVLVVLAVVVLALLAAGLQVAFDSRAASSTHNTVEAP